MTESEHWQTKHYRILSYKQERHIAMRDAEVKALKIKLEQMRANMEWAARKIGECIERYDMEGSPGTQLEKVRDFLERRSQID